MSPELRQLGSSSILRKTRSSSRFAGVIRHKTHKKTYVVFFVPSVAFVANFPSTDIGAIVERMFSMRHICALIAVSFCGIAAVASDWPTDGGNPQRTNWQKDETILNKNNVASLKILWKLKLDNAPRQ